MEDGCFDQVLFLENCSHMVCKECLKVNIDDSYPESVCPVNNCEGKVLDVEVKNVLGDKEYEQL